VLEPGDRVCLEGNNQKHADPKPPRRPRDSSVEARTAVSPGRSALAPDALSWNTRASLGEGIKLQRWILVGRRDPRVAELRHLANALCPKTRPTTMCLESHHQRRSADSVAPDRQTAHWRSRSLRTLLSCNDLQSSAARPDFIGRNLSTFGEIIGGVEPELSETQPELTETNPQSSAWDRIP